MTESELRNAAERMLDSTIAPARALAKAWLAEHSADDGTLISAEWLQSMGFIWKPEWLCFTPDGWCEQCVGFFPHRDGVWTMGYEGDFVWPHDLRTRGEVRRLVKCLGIELTERKATT